MQPCSGKPCGYDGGMDDDHASAPTWRDRLPYVIGFFGLLAWFGLLYFMLRDVA